jgi:hypothetical protein
MITYENSNRERPNECYQTCGIKPTKEWLDGSFATGGIPDWDYRWAQQGPWIVDLYHNAFVHWMPNLPWTRTRSQPLEVGYNVDAELSERLITLEAGCANKIFALPRAVAELRDVPKTFNQVTGMLLWAQRMCTPSYVNRVAGLAGQLHSLTGKGGFRDWSVGKTVNQVASLYLMIEFGIKPTASDIAAVLGKPRANGKPWELWSREITYKRGQKLKVPFRLEPKATDFPSFEDINLSVNGGTLFRDYHSSNLIREAIYGHMRCPAYVSERHVGCLFGEVIDDHVSDWTYGDMLAYSGGGLFATAWERTPWTWFADSMYDFGRWIAQAERRSVPVTVRPALKFGAWQSHGKGNTLFLPKWKATEYSYGVTTHPDPSSGFGGAFSSLGKVRFKGYFPVETSGYTYERNPITKGLGLPSAPSLRVPGGYILGPMAAVTAQFASGSKITSHIRIQQ